MNFSARMILTALLCVGAISLVLADPPCVQFAEDDNCSYGGCNLMIITACGPGSSEAQCRQKFITENQSAKFKCVTLAGVNSRCLPASGHKPCMKATYCRYDNFQMTCVPNPTDVSYCVAPYYETFNCPP